MRGSHHQQIRADIVERMWASRLEIEEAVMARVRGLTSPQEEQREEYAAGFKRVVTAVAAHTRVVIERGSTQAAEPPLAIRAQAQIAARNQISLSAVLRRCLGAHMVLNDFVVSIAQDVGPKGQKILGDLLREQGLAFDEMIRLVGHEHDRERHSPTTLEERRLFQVTRLLDGERCVPSELGYDFNSGHVGLVACGVDAAAELKQLIQVFDARHLVVYPNATTVWMWLGGKRLPDPDEFERRAATTLSPDTSLAVGERKEGRPGWELTHRQARATLPVAERERSTVVQYADSSLLAAMLADDLLAATLCERYLSPLEKENDGGERARETLLAYLATGQNTASAATSLGVSRRTVTNRLRAIEAEIGRPVANAAGEIETALRYERLLGEMT